MNFGYACLNLTLSENKIIVNRGLIKKTFFDKGLSYVSALIKENLRDLLKIIKWNHEHEIYFYRMSSDMFPWMSEYEIEHLPDFPEIKELLAQAGSLSKEFKIRLTFHPGPFDVLASGNAAVVANTVKDLNQHAQIMDLMGLERNPFNKINIHIGTTLMGNKQQAIQNFCHNLQLLNPGARERITVENDDKISMYNVKELYEGVFLRTGRPIVFDYHHFSCNPGDLTEKEALVLALSTWKKFNIIPVVHYSEPKSAETFRAHADFVANRINTYGYDFDVMLEAKQKEKALLQYKDLINKFFTN
jgi:UV DNA damage endonuclease